MNQEFSASRFSRPCGLCVDRRSVGTRHYVCVTTTDNVMSPVSEPGSNTARQYEPIDVVVPAICGAVPAVAETELEIGLQMVPLVANVGVPMTSPTVIVGGGPAGQRDRQRTQCGDVERIDPGLTYRQRPGVSGLGDDRRIRQRRRIVGRLGVAPGRHQQRRQHQKGQNRSHVHDLSMSLIVVWSNVKRVWPLSVSADTLVVTRRRLAGRFAAFDAPPSRTIFVR